MATIHRCDRCDAESPNQMRTLRTENSGGPFAELCRECLDAFVQWVKFGIVHKGRQE